MTQVAWMFVSASRGGGGAATWTPGGVTPSPSPIIMVQWKITRKMKGNECWRYTHFPRKTMIHGRQGGPIEFQTKNPKMDHRWIGRIPPNDIRKDQDECILFTQGLAQCVHTGLKRASGPFCQNQTHQYEIWGKLWNPFVNTDKFTLWLRADQKNKTHFYENIMGTTVSYRTPTLIRGFTGYLVEVPVVLPGTSSCLDETMKLLEGTLEESDAELPNTSSVGGGLRTVCPRCGGFRTFKLTVA